MTWKLNVDGIDDPKLFENKDYMIVVSRLKTKDILLPGVKSKATIVKMYIQRLDPSTKHFRFLVTTNNLYLTCRAKADRYQYGWESFTEVIRYS